MSEGLCRRSFVLGGLCSVFVGHSSTLDVPPPLIGSTSSEASFNHFESVSVNQVVAKVRAAAT